MSTFKTILGILLFIGGFASLIALFNSISTYKTPDTIGHAIAIFIIFALAIYLIKPKKKNNPN